MTRLREGLIDDPTTWATLRRRVLTKAVEYNEVTLKRLRAWLDQLPPAPNGQPSNGSAQTGSRTSSELTPSANDPSEAAAGEPAPPASVGAEHPPPSVGAAHPPPSVGAAHPGPAISPWVPPEVADAYPDPAEAIGPGAARPTSAHATARAYGASARSSVVRTKPSRTRRRIVIVASVVAIVLLAAAAGAALFYFHPWRSASHAPATPAAATRAFALPVLRHNRPRRFSIVLTRMALVTRESVVR